MTADAASAGRLAGNRSGRSERRAILKDYLLQQMRESSTWRGMVDIVVGVIIEFGLSQVTFLSSELTMMLHAIALGLIARGGIAVAAKDTTTAGVAVKNAQAQAAVDTGTVVVPPTPTSTPEK